MQYADFSNFEYMIIQKMPLFGKKKDTGKSKSLPPGNLFACVCCFVIIYDNGFYTNNISIFVLPTCKTMFMFFTNFW